MVYKNKMTDDFSNNDSFWCPKRGFIGIKENENTLNGYFDRLICGLCFPVMCNFCTEGFGYCDEKPQSIICHCCGPKGRPCIECYVCLSPIGLLVDLITIPIRLPYCVYYNTCKSKKVSNDIVVE